MLPDQLWRPCAREQPGSFGASLAAEPMLCEPFRPNSGTVPALVHVDHAAGFRVLPFATPERARVFALNLHEIPGFARGGVSGRAWGGRLLIGAESGTLASAASGCLGCSRPTSQPRRPVMKATHIAQKLRAQIHQFSGIFSPPTFPNPRPGSWSKCSSACRPAKTVNSAQSLAPWVRTLRSRRRRNGSRITWPNPPWGRRCRQQIVQHAARRGRADTLLGDRPDGPAQALRPGQAPSGPGARRQHGRTGFGLCGAGVCAGEPAGLAAVAEVGVGRGPGLCR